MWGLVGCRWLIISPIGRGERHRYLLLESREINPLPPQLGQVVIQIQERVPITSFEDWIHGLKVAHNLHQAGLPSDGIYQQTVVVPWLQDSGIQTVVVLHAMWNDEVTPCVFSVQLGVGVAELQGGLAYTTVQVHPCRCVPSFKMIELSTFDVSCGIHETIGRVRWDGHNATEILHKETVGTPLAGVMPSLENIACLLEVHIYVLDEVVDLAGAV